MFQYLQNLSSLAVPYFCNCLAHGTIFEKPLTRNVDFDFVGPSMWIFFISRKNLAKYYYKYS